MKVVFQGCDVEDEAAAVRQAAGECQQHHAPGRLLEPAGQRHGVGGTTEERGPFALAGAGHMIRQHADRFARAQRTQELPDATERRRRDPAVGAFAAGSHDRIEPAQFRRTIKHGDRYPDRGIQCRYVETSEVWCQEQDAPSCGARSFGMVPAARLDDGGHRRLGGTEPDEQQLEQALAGFADARPAKPLEHGGVVGKAARGQVVGEPCRIAWRQAVGGAPHQLAEPMQRWQRQFSEQPETGFDHHRRRVLERNLLSSTNLTFLPRNFEDE